MPSARSAVQERRAIAESRAPSLAAAQFSPFIGALASAAAVAEITGLIGATLAGRVAYLSALEIAESNTGLCVSVCAADRQVSRLAGWLAGWRRGQTVALDETATPAMDPQVGG